MKFRYDDIPLDKDWRDIPIKGKWATVFVESPKKLTKQVRFQLLMRMDSVLQGYEWSGGNNHPFLAKIHEFIDYPIEPPIKSKEWESYDSDVRKWRNKWGAIGNCSDGRILKVEMISSSYAGGPFSFFDYKTGKVAFITNIGRCLEKVGYVEKELKEFTKAFPNIPLIITVCDELYDKKIDSNVVYPLATLKVMNGKIKRIKIRTEKKLKKVIRKSKRINSFVKRKLALYKIKYIWYNLLQKIGFTNIKADLFLNYPYWYEESAFDENTVMAMLFNWLNVGLKIA